MELINIQEFFNRYNLIFESDKKGVAWVRKNLKPTSLVKVGSNFLVEKNEIDKKMMLFIKEKQKRYEEKVKRAKNMTENREKNKL